PSGSSVGTLPQWLCVRSVLCTPFGPAILPASSRSSSSSALSPTACTHPISSVFVAAIPATIGNSNWRSCAASAWMGGRGPCSLPALSALFFIGGSLSFRTVSSWQSPSSGRQGAAATHPFSTETGTSPAATLRSYCLARLEEHFGPLRERKLDCRKAGCARKRLEGANYCVEHVIADRFGRHLARLEVVVRPTREG